jgi:hypothetical protein
VKNGVPFQKATEELTDAEVMAYAVAFSEMEGGGRFNWDTQQFEGRND